MNNKKQYENQKRVITGHSPAATMVNEQMSTIIAQIIEGEPKSAST